MRIKAPLSIHFQFVKVEILFNENTGEAQDYASRIEFDFTGTVLNFDRTGQITESRRLPRGIR